MPASAVPVPMKSLKAKDFPAVFDSNFLEKQTEVPAGFVWPEADRPEAEPAEELRAPLVDVGGFLAGDVAGTRAAAEAVKRAGESHGFFHVINHGVDGRVGDRGLELAEAFFRLPAEEKVRAEKPCGSRWGYSAAHGERFSAKLPWKETLTFGYRKASLDVVDYFDAVLGHDFREEGAVYEEYSEAMFELCLKLVELLGISLGVGRDTYREFFSDAECIMRCNYYPVCPDPTLTLGTGPHRDPTSLTVLHQDHVGGLQVLHDHTWYSVSPVPGALVINIGDTFMALSNGKYKSCLHRALANKDEGRKSMAFFLCPKEDKVVRPPNELLVGGAKREYPDFTWADMIRFLGTSNYRADPDTLKNFINWFQQST